MFEIHCTDSFEWMRDCPTNSFQAVVTDPPYGLEEFSRVNLEKLRRGRGGIWRIPPKIGGSKRAPLPRFTVVPREQYPLMYSFFNRWAELVQRVLVPGGHIVIASNALFMPIVSYAIIGAGFEPRGIVVRLVRTLRGGFRPKGAEDEFQGTSTILRSSWEPWGLFRKPLDKTTLAENLRQWWAGALRRNPDGMPFCDVLISERTPEIEKKIAPHPTLKPQSLMRALAWAVLPLGKGRILDPFCGAGSTLAAAEALGYESVGIEIEPEYAEMAKIAVPKLASLKTDPWRIRANNHGLVAMLAERNSGRLDELLAHERQSSS